MDSFHALNFLCIKTLTSFRVTFVLCRIQLQIGQVKVTFSSLPCLHVLKKKKKINHLNEHQQIY